MAAGQDGIWLTPYAGVEAHVRSLGVGRPDPAATESGDQQDFDPCWFGVRSRGRGPKSTVECVAILDHVVLFDFVGEVRVEVGRSSPPCSTTRGCLPQSEPAQASVDKADRGHVRLVCLP